MLGQSANVIQIAKATNLSRQTVYRIKGRGRGCTGDVGSRIAVAIPPHWRRRT
jgi:DNA invertase Pin-like site-specific DNA recombinase